MTQETWTTKRLRELEADEHKPKDSRNYVDGVTLGMRRATIDGYKLALQDLAPVLAAARQAREAFEFTRQYVGYDLLPAIEGWSWYDADVALRVALAGLEME